MSAVSDGTSHYILGSRSVASSIRTTMRVSYYAPNYLDRLPTELFPLIIDNIGLDLVAHVTFCKLLPRVKHCYKGRGRAFWEPICRTSGLVCPQCSRDDDRAWSSFAIECGEHAERCKHPACGMTRLRENGKPLIHPRISMKSTT